MQFLQRGRRGGEQLKQLRAHVGLTTREVARLSHIVAAEQQSNEYLISHSWLVKVENEDCVPSICKLFTLSAIYGVSVDHSLSAYLDLRAAARLHLLMQLPTTHALSLEESQSERTVSIPVQFQENSSFDKTNLLSRVVEVWEEIPVHFLEHLNLRKCRYGFIGLRDHTMYPLIRPGSLVQIDDCQKTPRPVQYRSEYDRPIYFIELRNGYLCAWCELTNGRLVTIPHPLSGCRTQGFAFPSEAEIIGRVVGVAVRLVTSGDTDSETIGAPPRRRALRTLDAQLESADDLRHLPESQIQLSSNTPPVQTGRHGTPYQKAVKA